MCASSLRTTNIYTSCVNCCKNNFDEALQLRGFFMSLCEFNCLNFLAQVSDLCIRVTWKSDCMATGWRPAPEIMIKPKGLQIYFTSCISTSRL